jgi:ABC-type dipeptide/oligopeptide/nickel transport system ATPase component
LAGNPKLIIADEPTSNLDVTIQAKIVELFRRIKNDLKVSILLITHDIGMVGVLADETVVMNKGKVVEKGKTEEILKNPLQKYTQDLLGAL